MNNFKILIIEDDFPIALDLFDALEEVFGEHIYFSQSSSLEQELQRRNPKVVVIDFSHSAEYTEFLLSKIADTNLHIVATTTSLERIPDSVRYRTPNIFIKPVDTNAIIDAIKSLNLVLH